VRTGTAVSVSLSKGPAPVAVPDVKGLSRSAAESALKSAGLKVARVDEGFISTTPKDHVFGILPAPGTEVTRGTEVVIQVSTALEVPDIVGMSQEEGTKKLQEAGIKVDQIKQDNTTGTKAHQVVGTAPGPGTLIDPSSSSVDIVVAKKVKVPNVVGSKLADAKEKLEEAGLSASSSGSDSSRVITQSPRAGSEVDNGKSVTLKTIG
jgi:serine/threonine protein kinases